MSSAGGGSGASLFSDSGIPDVGGMMSALGTIGNSPASSGGGGGGGFGGVRRAAVGAAPAEGSSGDRAGRRSGPEQVAAGVEALDLSDGRGRARHRSSVIRKFCVVRATPLGARLPRAVLGVAERPRHGVRRRVVEERRRLGDTRPEAVEGEAEHRGAHLLAEPASLELEPEPRPGRHRPVDRESSASRVCVPTGTPSNSTVRLSVQSVGCHEPRIVQWCCMNPRSNAGLGSVDQATANGISSGGWMPFLARARSGGSSSSVGRRSSRRSVRSRRP